MYIGGFNNMLRGRLLDCSGIKILRLDAVAFISKQMGTTCQNLPVAHLIIQAFNTVAVAEMVPQGMVFKSEAIVHPDDVVKYIDWDECPLSYPPQLMALLWEFLATREVSLLRLQQRTTQYGSWRDNSQLEVKNGSIKLPSFFLPPFLQREEKMKATLRIKTKRKLYFSSPLKMGGLPYYKKNYVSL
ncbi:MAG: hypothetical protein KQH63_10700 [Desulfobulbaceae bacterium]|nr:hypothetical protein [Desulfobulbaceae bacterium]